MLTRLESFLRQRNGSDVGMIGNENDEFLNKGFVVWEAVRIDWKGTSEQVAAARKQSQEKGEGTSY